MALTYYHANYKNLTFKETTEKIIERSRKRQHFYEIALKMFAVAKILKVRLIMENPWSGETFLKHFFVQKPSLVDNNRMARGDYFIKPTAYWFINCDPTEGFTLQRDKVRRRIASLPPGKAAGICGEERSMISPDYARNFICDFIIGKEQPEIYPTLFNME